jgi:hypothetical protein
MAADQTVATRLDIMAVSVVRNTLYASSRGAVHVGWRSRRRYSSVAGRHIDVFERELNGIRRKCVGRDKEERRKSAQGSEAWA